MQQICAIQDGILGSLEISVTAMDGLMVLWRDFRERLHRISCIPLIQLYFYAVFFPFSRQIFSAQQQRGNYVILDVGICAFYSDAAGQWLVSQVSKVKGSSTKRVYSQ